MSRSEKTRRLTIFALGATAAALPAADAIEPAQLFSYGTGAWVFRPHVTSGVQYSDNLYYQSSGRKVSDFMGVVRPGIEIWLGKPAGDNFVKFAYDMDSRFYVENSQSDSMDHEFTLKGTFKGARLTSDNSDRLQYQDSIYGGYVANQAVTGTVKGGNLQRWQLDLSHRLDYKMTEKTSVYLLGTLYDLLFDRGAPYQDLITWRGTAGFTLKALPKTSFFGEVYYGQSDATPNSIVSGPNGAPSDDVGGYLGAVGNFTQRLTGTVKAGYGSSQLTDGSKGIDGPIVDASLAARFTDYTSVNLGYSRRSSLSIQYSGVLLNTDYFSLSARQMFGPNRRWTANLGGGYGLNNYPHYQRSGEDRNDDYFSLTAGLSYSFKLWLKTGLDYQYQRLNSSDKSAVDYQINTVTMSVTIGY